MNEEIQAHASEAIGEAEGSPGEPRPAHGFEARFPEEAFPCPHCGQMLGPAVRVCVACRQAIDPSQIRVLTVVHAATAAQAATVPRARFSWGIFVAALLAWLALVVSVMWVAGLEKAQYIIAAAQAILAAWVFSDARQKRFPRPFRWGAGTLLFPIVFLPWYFARRLQREASCPMVESGIRPFLLILLCCFAIALLIASRLTNLPK